MAIVYRLDLAQGELAPRPRTTHDALVAHANLTRVGVFPYRDSVGNTRRELRHPDDVFHPETLASFDGAPVTVDHPGRVTADNWRAHAVGHVARGVKREGDFAAGDIFLQDKKAQTSAEGGQVSEVSCGYQCRLEETPGEWEGQKYDARQRDIRINHVALGPKGWGRMGSETRLHLDSGEAISGDDDGAPRFDLEDQEPPMAMTPEEKAVFDKAVADAKTAATERDAARQDAADQTKKVTSLEAQNGILQKQVERATNDGADEKAQAAREAHIEATIQVRADARRVFASKEDPEGKAWKHDGKSVDQVKREVLARLEPDVRIDSALEGPALDAPYRMALSHHDKVQKANANLRATVLTAPAAGGRADGAPPFGGEGDEPDAEKSRKCMDARKRDAFKKGQDAKKDRRK